MNTNTYYTGKAKSLSDQAIFFTRKKIYDVILSEILINDLNSILDVGVTADKELDSSNFFEKLYPYPNKITAFSNQDASWMEDMGMKFVKGNALDMPFNDNTFDMAFSSAVIEHVGSRTNQKKFIKECIRVAKKYIIITTPNKYYPIELHTTMPLLHWLPPKMFRSIMNCIGKNFFALEENLNLLSKNDLIKLMNDINIKYKIKYIKFLGFKSNLLLIIEK